MADPFRPTNVYPPPNNSNSVYPPPNNPNSVYPPPGNSNDVYPPPGKSNDVYPPPGKSNDVYPPPDTNRNVATAYPAPNTNTGSSYVAVAPPPPPPQNDVAPLPPPPQEQGYNAPSPYVQKQSSFDHEDKPRSGGGKTCFRRLCLIIILLLILAGIIILIVWLIFRPRLPDFSVEKLSVSNFNLSGNTLSATWDLTLKAKNPNSKFSLVFDKGQAAMFFRGDSLVDTSVNPFTQGKKSDTSLNANFKASNKYLDNKVTEEIKKEKEKVGNVEFNLKYIAGMGFDAGIWKSKKRSLKVSCNDLTVSLSGNNGALTKGSKSCRVSF